MKNGSDELFQPKSDVTNKFFVVISHSSEAEQNTDTDLWRKKNITVLKSFFFVNLKPNLALLTVRDDKENSTFGGESERE